MSFGRDRQGLWEDSVAKPAIKSAVGGYPALSRTEDPVLYTKVALILLCLNVTPNESCKKVTLIVKVCEARCSGFCQRHLDSHVHSCRMSMCRGEDMRRQLRACVSEVMPSPPPTRTDHPYHQDQTLASLFYLSITFSLIPFPSLSLCLWQPKNDRPIITFLSFFSTLRFYTPSLLSQHTSFLPSLPHTNGCTREREGGVGEGERVGKGCTRE